MNELLNALGRLHPLVVHLPIGFYGLIVIFETLALLYKKAKLDFALAVVWVSAVVFCLLSAGIGYLLSLHGGYDAHLLEWHLYTGLALCLLSLPSAYLRYLMQKGLKPIWKKTYYSLLAANLLLLAAVGHYGGSITHGSEYLNGFVFWSGNDNEQQTTKIIKITSPDSAMLYEDLIQPMLDEQCVACHGPSKKSGGLRLDSPDWMGKASNAGLCVVPGRALQSEMYLRTLLPAENSRRMPPGKGDGLDEKQRQLLAFWINKNMPQGIKVADMELSDEEKDFVVRLIGREPYTPKVFSLTGIAAPDSALIEQLFALNVVCAPVYKGSHLLEVRTINAGPNFNDTLFEQLLPLAPNIAVLNLAGTSLSTGAFEQLSRFTHLYKLNLAHTAAGNETVAALRRLAYLEQLNLYQSAVIMTCEEIQKQIPTLKSCTSAQ